MPSSPGYKRNYKELPVKIKKDGNVQLVASALNSWRADTDLEEFLWWCSKVTNWQEKEGR